MNTPTNPPPQVLIPAGSRLARGTLLTSRGLQDVLAERIEQIDKHGQTVGTDRNQPVENLTDAAEAFLVAAGGTHKAAIQHWPWSGSTFRPRHDMRGNLVKAAAMLLAALDRIDHAAPDAPLQSA